MTRISWHFRLFFMLIFFINYPASGQSAYSIKHYMAENGLPQNSVKFIGQDMAGFLWIATEDGLVRYDGHNFHFLNRSNLNIKDTRVTHLECRTRGSFNPGTGRNESMTATFAGDHYIKIEKGNADNDSLESTQNAIKVDNAVKNPNHFYKTVGLPDIFFGTQKLQYQSYKIQPNGVDGSFYSCGNKKVTYFKKYRKLFEIKFDASNIYNFLSLSGTLFYYNQKNASFTLLSREKIKTLPVTGEILTDTQFQSGKQHIQLYWNHVSDQVFLCLGKSLYMLHISPDFTLSTQKLIDSFDFKGHGITRIHYNTKNRKLYLGSNTNGLFEITRRQFQTLTVKGDNLKNAFYAQIPFDNNTILTPDGQQIGFDTTTGKVIEKELPAMKNAHSTDKRAIIRDNNGTIWIKDEHRLIQMNATGTKVLRKYFFGSLIKTIHQMKTGAIGVGLERGELYQIDLKSSQQPVQFVFKFTEGFAFTYLASLANGTLIAGTNSGMYFVNILQKSVRLIRETKGLYIKSIHPSENGNVWITALGKGLLLMNSQQRVVSFPLDKNRYLDSPHCVIHDKAGYLWIPTNRGLFQLKENDLLAYANLKLTTDLQNDREKSPVLPELFYIYHAMDEGFLTNEFNGNCQPCAALLPNGYISLPSLKGLVWFKPQDIIHLTLQNVIVLDQLNVSQKPLTIKSDTLYFPKSPENIRLHFSTENPGNIYNQKLSYALVKKSLFEKTPAWIPIENEDFTIRYSSLGSGSYTLIVRKLTGLGIDNYSYKKLFIVIPPRWYETWWAWMLFASSAIFLLYKYVRYRIRLIQRENQQLEVQIKERTSSLRFTMLELQQSKNEMTDQIHILSRLLASITHDVQSPLNYITYTSAKIDEMVQHGELEKVSRLGTIISDVSNRMATMLKEQLDYIKIQVYGNKMQFRDVILAEILNKKIGIFKNTIENNRSKIYNKVPEDLMVFSDYQLLSIIIHNLIDNAAKYTQDGRIRIYSQKDADGKIEMIISNTGVPLSEEIITFFNGDHKPQNETATDKSISGIGLFIVKEIAEMIGVEIQVSQTDQTYFHLFFDQ